MAVGMDLSRESLMVLSEAQTDSGSVSGKKLRTVAIGTSEIGCTGVSLSSDRGDDSVDGFLGVEVVLSSLSRSD